MYEVYCQQPHMKFAWDPWEALGFAVASAARGRPASVVRDGALLCYVEVAEKKSEDDPYYPAIVHISYPPDPSLYGIPEERRPSSRI